LIHMTRKTDRKPIVEIDEEAMAERRRQNEEFMQTPEMLAAMEEGRRALEAEIAAAAAREASRAPAVELDYDLETAAEREKREKLRRQVDAEEPVVFGWGTRMTLKAARPAARQPRPSSCPSGLQPRSSPCHPRATMTPSTSARFSTSP
jgi:hypothetical protein